MVCCGYDLGDLLIVSFCMLEGFNCFALVANVRCVLRIQCMENGN